MTTYEPCGGTEQRGLDVRLITGATGKFFRMNGQRHGDCPSCGKRLNLRAGDVLPRHKEQSQ